MPRVLVTGAAGFIGRHVVERLAEQGDEVVAVRSRAPAGEERPLAGDVRWRTADLLDPDVAHALIREEQPAQLVHLAWYARPGAVWGAVENVRWVEASLRLLRAFGEGEGSGRALFVGSCAEYDWTYGLCSERRTPTRPESLYGAAKDGLRRVAVTAAEGLGVSLAWARPFFLYGPYEHVDRLVPAIALPLLRGEPAPCSGGSQMRDYIHVSDAAAALAALLRSELTGPVNIGTGVPVRVRDLIAQIGDAVGRPELIRYGALGGDKAQAPLVVADVGRLRDELGWGPGVGLEAGLERTVSFWRSVEAGRSAR